MIEFNHRGNEMKIIILLCLLLTSCVVSNSTIQIAQKLCKSNGGIMYLIPSYSVRCNNDARFDHIGE